MASVFAVLLNTTGQFLTMEGILVFLCVLVLVKYLSDHRPKNVPPGPVPLPLIGNVLSLDFRDPVLSFSEICMKYGEVTTLYLGSEMVILLSGYKSFKEAFVEQADIFADRADYPLNDQLTRGLGLISSSGHAWSHQRRFAIAVLKHFGVGKKSLETSILQESRYLCEALHSQRGLAFNPDRIVTNAVTNIICNLVFGHRFEYDDEHFRQILLYLNDIVQLPAHFWGQLYNRFPTLMSWLPGKHQTTFSSLSKIKLFILEEIQKHRQDRNPTSPRDYIDYYLDEIEKGRDSKAQFTEENLVFCVVDLFAAGTETTSNTMLWTLLYMAKYPEVQEKVHAEIDQVIGQARQPSMNDRPLMPYTYAVIHEVLRAANALNITPPRVASRDTTIAGYLIPKGVTVFPLLRAIMQDKNEFSTPDEFNPGHFLDENGKFLKKEGFIPFSIGKRMCPGEQMVNMEFFLFFTCLLQSFSFHAPEGQTLKMDSTVGITTAPKPFQLRAIPR
ncbi:cytochrome P450 2J4-like [Salminus brasiliensis]|uniref:cytochrome P450 2J4-like n=1 Tax=Salminus brasiliensis TaxID=930266 RepID=UPI003B830726